MSSTVLIRVFMLMFMSASAMGAVGNTAKKLMPQEGFGGLAVDCRPGDRNAKVVTLDYYNAALPSATGPASLIDVDKMSTDEVIHHVGARVKNTPFFEEFDWALNVLGPWRTWPIADLSNFTDDSKEPYHLPSGCQRRQAAYRQGDTVYLDQDIIKELSPGQLGVLVVHEALYWIASNRAGQTTSEHVRALIRPILDKVEVPSRIELLISNIGGTAWPMQKLKGLYRAAFAEGGITNTVEFTAYDPQSKMIQLHLKQHPAVVKVVFKCERTPASYNCNPIDNYIFMYHSKGGEMAYSGQILPTSTLKLPLNGNSAFKVTLEGVATCVDRDCVRLGSLNNILFKSAL